MRCVLALTLCLSVALLGVAYAAPGKPDFSPHIYGDGVAWGTKVTVNQLPPPNDHNMQSFDKLFAITNSNNPDDQLAVAEAAPGNPMYNGGRWATQTVTWTGAGFAAYGTVPILKSYDDVMYQESMGYLTITPGSPPGGPPDFFLCPLLPVK